jgi:hypothetical protein
MPEFLKGNYKVDATIEDNTDAADSTDAFEKKALSRLGGSICFVSKKSLIWQGEAQPAGGAAAAGEATTRTASRATPEKGETDGAGTKDSRGA